MRIFSVRFPLAFFTGFAMIAMIWGSQSAHGGGTKDFSIHQPYVGYRPLGMGNAFTAVADDYNTLFYNPAGLSRLKQSEVNLGIGAMVNPDTVKFYNDVNTAAKSNDVSQIASVLQKDYGNHYSARLNPFSGTWVAPNWGFAILPVDLSIDFEVHQLAAAALDLVAYNDTTIAYGRGWDVNWFQGGDQMSLGITGKTVYRAYYNKSFLAPELAIDNKILRPEDAEEGVTVDADFGSLWTPKIGPHSFWRFSKPTLGLVVRNVVDEGFFMNPHFIGATTGKAPALGRRVDFGTKFELPDWWIFKPRIAADMRDMGTENFTFKKGSHVGAELLWHIRSWWRGGWRVGLSQGYLTTGFTGVLGIFSLDLVTYAEDVGPSDAPKADRRYAVKLSLDW